MNDGHTRVRDARERLPGKSGRVLSREALAGRIGVSTTTLQTWERSGLPGRDNLAALARALEVSLDYLFGLTDDPTPHWAPRGETEPVAAMQEVDKHVAEPPPPPPRVPTARELVRRRGGYGRRPT